MAKKKTKAKADAPPEGPVLPTTQRAYTLRLRRSPGVCPHCQKDDCACWRDALWATHEAVNKGAKVFGDWLLTFRGGLSHELAEPKGKQRNIKETAALRKNRRILLALSWLSVEDMRGAPEGDGMRLATGKDSTDHRRERLLESLHAILAARGVEEAQIKEWKQDCRVSLAASIREDAVWVNRSAAFEAAVHQIGPGLSRKAEIEEEVWDILEPFFGSCEAYLAPVATSDDEDNSAGEEKAKDLVQKAGQWLSSRFGTGKGADFASMAKVYAAIVQWANNAGQFPSGAEAIGSLVKALACFKPATPNAKGVLGLISGPGYKSATRNIVESWGERADTVSQDDVNKLAETAKKDEGKCNKNVGGKGRRVMSDKLLAQVEKTCGFTYLQTDGPARHSEFAVMLDHAARRVSIGHSWIKRAEAQRRNFKEGACRLKRVPTAASKWLDEYVRVRSDASGALAAGGEYRIRRRAFAAWDDVLKRWSRADCKTADRIAAAREVQADPEIEKFGDIQLFEALAAEDAECVWRFNGKADPSPLRDYVLGHDARFRQRWFKVPAYRHPDMLRHPVFCDFGNSRWDVDYALHRRRSGLDGARKKVERCEDTVEKAQAGFDKAKTSGKEAKAKEKLNAAHQKLAMARDELTWLSDPRAMRMGLWTGDSVVPIGSLRWSSKRLATDLGSVNHNGDTEAAVSRGNRLGRAAAGVSESDAAIPAGLFEQKEWNARLQAPRRELDRLAARVERHGWDAKALQMRDNLSWLVSFSPRLRPSGPFINYAATFDDGARAKPFVSRKGEYAVKHESNDKRQGHAKLILSRLPGLRVLSVDLGHRFAAACAVWEALPISSFEKEIAGRAVAAGGSGKRDLFLHTRHTDERGKERTTIYRRIGSDTLPVGSDHPAPWARLDRQFLIKLQGEEKPARAASPAELEFMRRFEKELGRIRDEQHPLPRPVDDLMAETMRSLRLRLTRHAWRAKIAWALDPKTTSILGMGDSETAFQPGDENHLKLLTNALFDWHALATDRRWDDTKSRNLWNEHIASLTDAWKIEPPKSDSSESDERTYQQRRKDDEALRDRLKPIAQLLVNSDRAKIHGAWRDRWQGDDGAPADRGAGALATGWHARLRQVTDWITGRRYPADESPSHGWKQNVGGLSLTRIATMRSLYRLHKAFAMRAKPRQAPRRAGEGREQRRRGPVIAARDGAHARAARQATGQPHRRSRPRRRPHEAGERPRSQTPTVSSG